MTGPSTERATDTRARGIERVGARFGADNLISGADPLAAYEVDGLRPAVVVMPNSAEEIAELLRISAEEKLAVIPCSGRTKLGIGAPPTRYDVALDLSRMNRVLAYEPRDLTLGVEPGVTVAELWGVLGCEGQWLPIIDAFGERATIGGVLSADSASPLRHGFGGPRDFTLGMEFVTGYGAVAKSGGRVVKNVSGYDLHKVLIGSLGTLGVITRANFKTFPWPPARDVFVAHFADCDAAIGYCQAIQKSALEPRLVEVISPESEKLISSRAKHPQPLAANGWSVVVGVTARRRVVERHASELATLASQHKTTEFVRIGGEDQSVILNTACTVPSFFLAADSGAVVFRIAAVPAVMAALALQLTACAAKSQMQNATVLRPYGLVYFALLPQGKSTADVARATKEVFRAADEMGAKARIEFAPTEVKRAVNVWGAVRPDFELMGRVKNIFDPNGILSPGRYAGGI